jgi:hypothetical protein
VEISVERQASEQNAQCLAWRSSTNRVRHLAALCEVTRETEVRNDSRVSTMPHERLGSSHRMRMAGMVSKPSIEFGDTAIELIELVMWL